MNEAEVTPHSTQLAMREPRQRNICSGPPNAACPAILSSRPPSVATRFSSEHPIEEGAALSAAHHSRTMK